MLYTVEVVSENIPRSISIDDIPTEGLVDRDSLLEMLHHMTDIGHYTSICDCHNYVRVYEPFAHEPWVFCTPMES